MTKHVQTKNIEIFVNATLSLATGLGLDTEETLGAIFIIQRRLSKRENVPLLQFLQRIFDATLHVVLPKQEQPSREEDQFQNAKCTDCPEKHKLAECSLPNCPPLNQRKARPEAVKAKGKRLKRKQT